MSRLTVHTIKKLTNPGRYADGRGLYLRVAPGGSKSWIQRITLDGKRTDKGLGGYPDVSLAQARRRVSDNRSKVADGENPWTKEAVVPSFCEVAKTVHALRAPTFRREITGIQWMQALEKHAMPSLGDKPIDKITAHDVLAVLMPIWNKNPEASRKVRQRIRTILQYAVVSDWIQYNPADDRLNSVLPRLHRQNKNFRSLPYPEVPAALETIDASGSSLTVRLCFRFLVLTACRSIEARGATWSEIDLQDRVWIIPPPRMKTNREHRVPLSDAALQVLGEAMPLANKSGLVFPSPQKEGARISNMTMTKCLRDNSLGARCTVHGFRSSFRSWALEATDASWSVCESALSHRIGGGGVASAYIRTDLFERRRKLMLDWARFLMPTKSTLDIP